MSFSRTAALVLLLLNAVFCARGQETVTILKSRLDELQRKEIELEKLKAELATAHGQNTKLKKQHEEDVIKISSAPAAQPAAARLSPPIESLPALSNGEIVDAIDLANHYRTDVATADHRYRKHTFKVRGEITAFEKPPFIRDYRILLKTAGREMRVMCEFYPPEKYQAVLTIRNGSELVAQTSDRNRVPIAKVGDTVIIEGECRGVNDSVVKLSRCELRSVP